MRIINYSKNIIFVFSFFVLPLSASEGSSSGVERFCKKLVLGLAFFSRVQARSGLDNGQMPDSFGQAACNNYAELDREMESTLARPGHEEERLLLWGLVQKGVTICKETGLACPGCRYEAMGHYVSSISLGLTWNKTKQKTDYFFLKI